ncbi:unnamed protein product [Camellia sinensis]
MTSLLDAMANTGIVELGEVHLGTYLFEKTFTGQPSFQNGLRSLIAFPSGCNTTNCLISPHKSHFFSKTGECAAPFVRQANLLALCCFGICAMLRRGIFLLVECIYLDLGLFNKCGQWQLTLRNAVNRAKGQREGRAKTPALVPEDADPIWSVGSKTILSERTGMQQRIGSIRNGIHNHLGDPRIHPVLLLGALMSFGSI